MNGITRLYASGVMLAKSLFDKFLVRLPLGYEDAEICWPDSGWKTVYVPGAIWLTGCSSPLGEEFPRNLKKSTTRYEFHMRSGPG